MGPTSGLESQDVRLTRVYCWAEPGVRITKPLIAIPRAAASDLAFGLAGASVAAAMATAGLIATNLAEAPQWPAFLEIIPLTVAYAIAGLLIALRQPKNAIGWVFLLISTGTCLTALADAYSGHHMPRRR